MGVFALRSALVAQETAASALPGLHFSAGADAVAAVSRAGPDAAYFLSSWLGYAATAVASKPAAWFGADADPYEDEYWANLYNDRDEEMEDLEAILNAENEALDADTPAAKPKTKKGKPAAKHKRNTKRDLCDAISGA